MNTLKLTIACKNRDIAKAYAAEIGAVLFTSNSPSTDHLPFAAMIVGTTDDLEKAQTVGDAGVYLVCERTIKNQPLDKLGHSDLPGIVGLFPMVAHPVAGASASDAHWRDNHAPLALEVHTRMTHYYQYAILHTFSGPALNGIAACCCATEDDLRHHFYGTPDGEQQILSDIRQFADTKRSPRRVIAIAESFVR